MNITVGSTVAGRPGVGAVAESSQLLYMLLAKRETGPGVGF